MRIINLVDSLEQVNFGVWNAAISAAESLNHRYSVKSELWYPKIQNRPHLSQVKMVPLESTKTKWVHHMIKQHNLNPKDTIVISHGSWQYPTIWGNKFKQAGFKWIYVPHGMLEPWSLQQKKWKKLIYMKLQEKPFSMNSDIIRAVGKPEFDNLKKIYPENKIILIPNGINTDIISLNKDKWNLSTCNYLFMARLHHKKGIIPLVKAWINSPQATNSSNNLFIAGPDDGELPMLQSLLKNTSVKNIKYLGPVYGDEKKELLKKCHIYMLPSHSEGFPSSVLEAMAYGLVPVISPGCNFPEAFEANTAIKTTPEKNNIEKVLNMLHKTPKIELQNIAENASKWIKQHYSISVIASLQAELYTQLLNTDT